MLRPALALTTTVLMLAGCSTNQEPVVPESPPETPEELTQGMNPTAGPGEEPEAGECESLPSNQDGNYAAGDAGTATVRLAGDELLVDEVQPAEGWESQVVTEESDRVVIEFTGEETYELAVEIGDDGLAAAELCGE